MTGDAEGRPQARIGTLPTLPVFFKLRGRTVLLAGGSEPAVWKAELLAAAGARVLVCDAAPCPAMVMLASTGAVTLEWRAWRREDLAGMALAIGALTEQEGSVFRDAASAAGVPVNIVDVPALCDFQFGTLVERSPLVVAITTDGAAPVFGQALRTRIEALLPQGLRGWAQAAKDWRPAVQEREFELAARRRFWEAFSARALDGSNEPPTDADRAAFMHQAEEPQNGLRGRIDFVGLGPGSPDRLTLQAVQALQSADEIIVGHDTDLALTLSGRREAARTMEPDGHAQFLDLILDRLGRGQRIAFAALGDPWRCERWIDRRSALGAVHPPTLIEGLSCPTCNDNCASRRAASARA